MPLLAAGCKDCWGEPVQACVRAAVVIVDPPCLDNPVCCGQAPEQVLVHAFVPEPPLEAFHKPVLLRLTRRDGVPQRWDAGVIGRAQLQKAHLEAQDAERIGSLPVADRMQVATALRDNLTHLPWRL